MFRAGKPGWQWMRMFLRACGAFAVVLVSFYVTLFSLDYFAPPCPGGEALELKGPFQKIGTGFAFAAAAPSLDGLSDNPTAPARSKFLVCENNHVLGPPHTLHQEIISKGKGRFSHYSGAGFTFSASDNSDPNTNGRRYWAVSPSK
jgi:hypothetical protein